MLWALAVVAAQVGVWSLHWLPGRGRAVDVGHTEVAAAHLIERFRLFFIIALGESVLITGSAFVAAEAFTLERLAALTIAFTGTVALWWCYFERAELMAVGAAEAAEDAGALGLRGTWTLVLLVLALLAIATAPLSLVLGIAAATAVLVVVAVADTLAPAGSVSVRRR